MTEQEKSQILEFSKGPQIEYDKERTFIDIFKEMVSVYPDVLAIEDEESGVTYKEADEYSDCLAQELRKRGAATDCFVAIMLPRKKEFMLAVLGVMKAGAAYLPIDKDYPSDRIDYMIEDSHAVLVITESSLGESIKNENLFFMDKYHGEGEPIKGCSPKAEDLAYMIYTSGSTGKPKGVMIRHQSLRALTVWKAADYQLKQGEVCSCHASFSFDASVIDLFPILTVGGTLYIVSDAMRYDIEGFVEMLGKKQVVDCLLPTKLGMDILNEYELPLRSITIGGERYKKVKKHSFSIYNAYGPTEFTVASSYHLVDQDQEDGTIPIGKPVANSWNYVLGEHGELLPVNTPGELLLSGVQIAKGYYNRPDLTKERFVVNPYATCKENEKMYHTGDLAQWNENGELEYLGRMDTQVKLNGFRIELGEIEAAVTGYPGIKDAVAQVVDDHLVAYYIPEEEIEEELLKKSLGERMPGYMVPSYFVSMEAFPITPNGKVDMKKLAKPDIHVEEEQVVVPTTKMQRKLLELLGEILGQEVLSVAANFMNLGLNSLSAMKLSAKIARTLHLTIGAKEILRLGNILTLEGALNDLIWQERMEVTEGLDKVSDTIYEKREYYPMTAGQLGVYLECVLNPESTMYNLPYCLTFEKGTMDPGRLAGAFEKAIDAHPFVKTYVGEKEEEMVLIRNDNYQTHVLVTPCQEHEMEGKREAFLRPFDLGKAPLFRIEIYETKEHIYVLFDLHHLIADGLSYVILLNDVGRAYQGENLEKEVFTTYDLAAEEEKRKSLPAYENDQTYWKNLLEGNELELNLPFDRTPAKEGDEKPCVSYYGTLSEVAEIEEFTKKNALTESNYFMGAFAYTLAYFSGREDAVFCSVDSGRDDPRCESLMGMLVRTMPVYLQVGSEPHVIDYLKEVQQQFEEMIKHNGYPFGEIARQYDMKSDILYVYQGDGFNSCNIGGQETKLEAFDISDAKANISCMIFKEAGHYVIQMEYRTDLYEEPTIERFVNSMKLVLQGMLTNQTFQDIRLLTKAEEAQQDDFNATECEKNQGCSIVDLFRAQAKKTPDRDCVVYKECTYSYEQMDNYTDRLAKAIRAKGIGKDEAVGILIPRCEYMVLASLGVLKAGAAYEPLDPTYPKERLSFMLEDASVKLLILDEQYLDKVDYYQGELLVTKDILCLEEGAEELPSPMHNDLFSLLYTSGSTGTPKGCMLTHGNLVNFCTWYQEYYQLTEEDAVAAYASFGFDASMMDIYAPITCGAAVHIIPEEIRLDLLMLNEYFKKNHITNSFMTTQVGRQFAVSIEETSLRNLSVGGETLVPCNPPKGYHLYNGYGPSECTIFTTTAAVEQYYEKEVPIGRPVHNTKLYVVDSKLRRVPIGVPGELCIAGHLVSRGYLNREELTAEKFISNPFETKAGYERMYRSGDIVKWMPNGQIMFVGRKDSQVKIRGFRIELSEIEQKIREYPGIKDVTVVALDDAGGGKYIASYVVSDEKISIEGLHAFIEEDKPPYMVPAVTMQIDAIPLNQNQKVNKKALPTPKVTFKEVVRPGNEIQQKLYDIIVDVVGNEGFGIDTDLYMAGLNSIGAVKLNVKLAKEFEIQISSKDFKKYNTIQKLELYIDVVGSTKQTYEKEVRYPLTQTQMGIYLECLKNPESTVYNIPMLLVLSTKVDADRLTKAVKAALDAHSYLKTYLQIEEGGVFQVRNDEAKAEVTSRTCTEEEMTGIKEGLVRPFEFTKGFYRAQIIKTEEHVYLFFDAHHMIYDGTSTVCFLSDVNQAYEGTALEPEIFTAFEAASEEQRQRASQEFEIAKKYYHTTFGAMDTDTRLDYDMAEGQSEVRGTFEQVWTGLDKKEVQKVCDARKITPNSFFLGAFGFTMAQFKNQESAAFCTVYNGRNDSRIANSIGMFVKTLPVYCNLEGISSIDEYLRTIKDQVMDSMEYDCYSFGEISRELHIKADTIFVYQGDAFSNYTIAGETAEMEELELSDAKSPLSVSLYIEGEQYKIAVDYRADLYKKETIQRFVNAYCEVAKSQQNAQTFAQLNLISKEEKQKIATFNDTKVEIQGPFIPRILHEIAMEHKEKTALIANGEQMTFKELDEASNRVARKLIARGVGADHVIAVMLPRNRHAYIAREGVLKAGGAFLSIDPQYPKDRIQFILKDSHAAFVLTNHEECVKQQTLCEGLACEMLEIEELEADGDATFPEVDIKPEDLCYCIYTSGSTGKPKGVMVEHQNLRQYCYSNDKNMGLRILTEGIEVSLAFYAFTFDASILDEFVPRTHGITVCMAGEEEIHNPMAMKALLRDYQVDCMMTTPSYFTNIVDMPELKPELSCLKMIGAGGENFPQVLYQKLRAINPSAHIINMYGPSETTVSSTYLDMHGQRINIGKPMSNTKCYIFNRYGALLPIGVPGELIISGSGVVRGYMGRPDLTKKSFFTYGGERAYHSGDLAAWNEEGTLEFFGRIDNQVKLRGLRVELDEIEVTMNEFQGVKSSTVLVKGEGDGQFLCGYYAADQEIDNQLLKEYLATKLTPYMVPGVLLQLDEMPLTVNGKVNKKALPEPEYKEKERIYIAPENEVQAGICKIMEEALNLEKVGITDNFFELGGTSLKASEVAMKAMNAGYHFVYGDIFKHGTPKELAVIECELNKQEQTTKFDKQSVFKEYDYTRINQVLEHNCDQYLDEIVEEPIANLLLTGATGFLGIHVLREYLRSYEGDVYCLIRKGKAKNIETRMNMMLMYYFDTTLEEQFGRRIHLIEGDITDKEVVESLEKVPFQTCINCAASVKHFVADDSLTRINVMGVCNLLDLCKKTGRRLIQVSTVSIGGDNVNNCVKKGEQITENKLYFGQEINNQYIESKFLAEREVLQAIVEGVDAKIMRVGNLMSRYQDGEFQINFQTNGFMRQLRGYEELGKFPMEGMHAKVEFSPIGFVANLLLRLAGTPKQFCVFHPYNNHEIYMADVIANMNYAGLPIEITSNEEFQKELAKAMDDEKRADKVAGLIAYLQSDTKSHIEAVTCDNLFTTQAGYRLGFRWAITDKEYLQSIIEVLKGLEFFGV